jgi:hypothetical protein
VKREALLQTLRDTRELLLRPDNNFAWSGWAGGQAAVEEIDALIESAGASADFDRVQLRVLFAPTGPIQEVSLSSGWGDAFLELANRIDDALQ